MMTTAKGTGHQLFDRSRDPIAGEIDRLDAFSEGAEMLLRAIIEELNARAPAVSTGRWPATATSPTTLAAHRPHVSAFRAYLEAAAARFEDPRLSTVICVKSIGRPAFAA